MNTLEICSDCLDNEKSEIYCNKHKKYSNIIYEILFYAMGYKNINKITPIDFYKIFIYVIDHINFNNTSIFSESDIKYISFVKVLNKFPKNICHNIYNVYYKNNSKILPSKPATIDLLFKLFYNTYNISNDKCKMRNTIKLQRFLRKSLYNSISISINEKNVPINSQDPFSCDDINEIPQNKLFAYYDDIGNLYAFDAIELDYFIQKCRDDDIEPYNPYTRKSLSEKEIMKLKLFIMYNKLEKRRIDDFEKWESDIHAFTDLSYEIERCGFYNSPEWFMKMSDEKLMKTLKLFKNFSAEIEASHEYFINYNKKTFKYDFCKDGIRMFRKCNDDNYIICCNFIKALAFYSIDFYNNIPDWLINSNTSSNMIGLHHYATINTEINNIVDIEINNNRRLNNERQMYNMVLNRSIANTNSDNFLLYYYVEYM
jgi:hypothetical protein